METERKRVACYARYSTNMQREESISAQLRAMKKYCNDNGWEIVKTYTDEAFSATTDKRPQFQQMISDSSKRIFDIVLVHKLDRFTRNRYDSLIYKQKLRKSGIRLCSVLEKLDDSPESILLEGLLESINEFYSANLAREALKGMKENAFKCLYNGGSPGLGYDVGENNRFVINEAEAKAVMMIFSMYLSGYGYQQIAETLNSEGYRTKSGNLFVKSSFQSILTNEKYTGVYIFNRAESKGYDNKRNNHRNKPPEEIIRIEGGVPAIISREVFEEAQKIRRLKRNVLHHSKTLYLCSSVIKCGCCGAKMYGNIRHRRNKDGFNVYVCTSRKADCDNIKEIDKVSLDEYVTELVKKKYFIADEKLHSAFNDMDKTTPSFRALLEQYIHEIVVYRDYVIFIHLSISNQASIRVETLKTERQQRVSRDSKIQVNG